MQNTINDTAQKTHHHVLRLHLEKGDTGTGFVLRITFMLPRNLFMLAFFLRMCCYLINFVSTTEIDLFLQGCLQIPDVKSLSRFNDVAMKSSEK